MTTAPTERRLSIGVELRLAVEPDLELLDVEDLIHLARAFESAGVDFVRLPSVAESRPWPTAFEPLTLAARLQRETTALAFVVGAEPDAHPFHLARRLASLDHLGGGRIGWSQRSVGGLGQDARDRARLVERTAVVRSLWDSWDDDAFVRDREAGRYYEPDRLHPPLHHGDHYTVRGPLNVSRPPQGHPPLVGADTEGDETPALLRIRLAHLAEPGVDDQGGDDVGSTASVLVPGGPEHVAELVGSWWRSGTIEAVLVVGAARPELLDDVLPTLRALRAAGAASVAPAPGSTLRDRLGLRRPDLGTARTAAVVAP